MSSVYLNVQRYGIFLVNIIIELSNDEYVIMFDINIMFYSRLLILIEFNFKVSFFVLYKLNDICEFSCFDCFFIVFCYFSKFCLYWYILMLEDVIFFLKVDF